MIFVDRPDGRRIRGLKPFSAILPYVMRSRNESAVYFSRGVEVEAAMRYARERNGKDGVAYSLFGIIMAAAARTLMMKPALNRFVKRRAVYQRDRVSVSFLVKKRLTEEAEETDAKVLFEPGEGLAAMSANIATAIESARSDEPSPDEREMRVAHAIPGGKALVIGAFAFLDRLNIAPAWMIRNDPLYTSVYFANLGSIGLDAPYHHLYEWGTASIFIVIGRPYLKDSGKREDPSQRRHFLDLRVTVDERIAAGIYFAHAAALFQRLIQKPQLMEGPFIPGSEAHVPAEGA